MKISIFFRGISASIFCSFLVALSASAQDIVSTNLLTNSQETTPWQSCDVAGIEITDPGTFDPSLLANEGCAYRETPAEPGQSYTFTCGVSSFKYSSLTLAFLDDAGNTLDSQLTDVFEDVNGSARSASLVSPPGTTIAAVGIYGLEGSGFQDCTLLTSNIVNGPEDGSISGMTWYDRNSDTQKDPDESLIPSTTVVLLLNGMVVDETVSNSEGTYYFGGLDLDLCFTLQFTSADPALTFTSTGGDSQADTNGSTTEFCPSEATPNITNVNAGFISVPPQLPPEDFAFCGQTWMSENNSVSAFGNIDVTLANLDTGEQISTTSGQEGSFAFGNLPAGSYQMTCDLPSGFEVAPSTNTLSSTGNAINAEGVSAIFNLPADSNTGDEDACTIRYVNCGFIMTPVTLDPTVALNDQISGIVGDTLSVMFLENDMPCNADVDSVDIIGHNVPGDIVYSEATGSFVITNTTQSGTFSIMYGLRGACGSYDTAEVLVTIEDAPPPPAPAGPPAPEQCFSSVGREADDQAIVGAHVDIFYTGGAAAYPPEYRFYDTNSNLVFVGLFAEARFWANRELYVWNNRRHDVDVFAIAKVSAVENGIESNLTDCIRRNITPIALDTNQSGRVDKIFGDFKFDIDADGINDNLREWVAPTEGILIVSDFDGRISGEHLFGNSDAAYKDGFAKLATFDRNNSGYIEGRELNVLAIWTDRNSNARVDDNEISSLDSHSIKQIPITHYKFAARATLNNGETMLIRDLWFAQDTVTQASLPSR